MTLRLDLNGKGVFSVPGVVLSRCTYVAHDFFHVAQHVARYFDVAQALLKGD